MMREVDIPVTVKTADLEILKKVMTFQMRHGAEVVVVTTDNCHLFADIPLLSARMIAAKKCGKHLAVDAFDNLTVLDRLPEPPKGMRNGIGIGYSAGFAIYDEVEPETEPRNRRERRQGRKPDKQVWEKDWRSR